MKEVFVRGKSLPEAYHMAITALHCEGEVLTSNDWNQRQKEVSMTFVAEEPLFEPMVSKLYIGGFHELQQYVMEIVEGILDFKIGDGWDYTYHDRMARFPISRRREREADSLVLEATSDGDGQKGYDAYRGHEAQAGKEEQAPLDQIQFVIDELRRQPDSRRAVMSIRDNGVDPFGTDPACLQHVQYFIRDGMLHCKVLLRSNDAPKASFMNAFAFVFLQKKIAGELGVNVGSYTHRANSYHAYERDFALLEQYAHAIESKGIEEITYEYEGFYRELMEERIPAIREMVEGLRNR